MSAMVDIVSDASLSTRTDQLQENSSNTHSNLSPKQLNTIKALHQELKATEKDTMPEMSIDPFHIKKEPEEKGYPDVENISTTSDQQRPETSSSLESDSLESAMTPRYHRARYFRRNYSSPECAVCEVCQAEFGGPDVLRLHKLAHFNTSSVCYVCDSLICDTNGESLGSKLMLHMTTHHKAICIPSGNYKPEAERAFACPICLQRFSSNKILTLHTLKQHNQSELTNFTCKICSMDFISARALHTHLLGSRHKDMKIKVQSIFMCVDCRAVFPARDSYAMHMMMRAQSESCTPLEECVKAMLREKGMKPSSPNSSEGIQQSSNGQIHNSLDMLIKQEKAESPPVNIKGLKEDTNCKYTKGEFICESCNLQFFHPDTLQMHRKMMHPTDDAIKKIQNGSSLTAIPNLNSLSDIINARSLIAQNTGMSWTCVACGYDFDSCDSLAMHVMDQHSGDLTIPITSTVNRLEQSKIASNLLAPILTQMMFKPPNRKIFENATLNAMVSSLNPLNKLPTLGLHLLAPRSSHNIAEIKTTSPADNIHSDIEVKPKRNLTPPKDSHVDHEEPPKKIMKGNYSCDECKSNFETESDLESHKKTCGTFYSTCSFCHVSFHDKGILLQHLKHCNPKTIGTCCSCGEDFKSIYRAVEHEEQCHKHGNHPNILCKKCQTVLQTKDEVQSHFSQNSSCFASATQSSDENTKHSKETVYSKNPKKNATVVEQKEVEIYSCKYCPWTSNNGSEYVTHINEHHAASEVQLQKLDPPNSHLDSRGCDQDGSLSPDESNEIIQSLVQDAVASKRNKRKLKPGTRVVSTDSPEVSWHSTESVMSDTVSDLMNNENQSNGHGLIAIPVSPDVLAVTSPKNINSPSDEDSNQLDATGHENMQGQELLSYVLSNAQSLIMCKYCHVIYTDRTMYYLHMGLHNLNNPWQCNLCGKVCANVHEFSSHVIHYR